MSVLDEQRFSVSETSKLGIKRTGQTLGLWHRKGLRIRGTKKRVKLEAIYEGTQLMTSREAIKRFLAAVNGIKLPPN